MQIGELARGCRVNVQTVRFYERQGLLPNPPRKHSGYRVYSDRDVRRLTFIRQAKALGFSLKEVRDILRMRDRGQCPCRSVLAMAEMHLERIERQIQQLSSFRSQLTEAVKKWNRSGKQRLSADAFCALIENTMSSTADGGDSEQRCRFLRLSCPH